MKTRNHFESSGEGPEDFSIQAYVELKGIQHQEIELNTFSLTGLVYDAIGQVEQAYLWINLAEAGIVVSKSDKDLVFTALKSVIRQVVHNLIKSELKLGASLKIKQLPSLGSIEISCPGLTLVPASPDNEVDITQVSEENFGFYLAKMALGRVKAKIDIMNQRTGGSRVLIEIPNVRGAAS